MKSGIEIANVVATGELTEMVHLENLYEAAETPVVRYEREHHQGCYLRFYEEGPLITIYNSGKYIIRANTVDEVYQQNELLLEHLEEIGVPDNVELVSFSVNNLVAKGHIGREIAVKPLSQDLSNGDAELDETRSRLVYRLDDCNVTINVFRTGSMMLMGASSVDELENAWEVFEKEVDTLFNS